jgi:uncharacterized protein YdhG (YjbR/CyaY superfamily)
MPAFANAEEYIAAQPPETQARLRELQAIVREVVPDAQEVISYGMPTYKYQGGALYFGAAKRHVAIYGFVMHRFEAELRGYGKSKGAVRFPLDRPIPVELVRAMAQATVAERRSA